jgi:hypothetical protein
MPADGVLVTSDPAPPGFMSDEYDYQQPSGRLIKLKTFDPGTMQDTPANRTNTKDVGTYNPRGGSSATTDGCTIEDEIITVGTSAYILSEPKPLDIDAYMRRHPDICSGRSSVLSIR